MAELFEEKQWSGEFFIPDQYERRFCGRVNFSPENGVILSYTITGYDVPSDSEILYGVLEKGEKCSLVGKFSPQNSGFSLKNGLNTRHGKAGFLGLLIGDFIEPDELFYYFDFSLTKMQEFFFPKGYKDLVKYSDKPLFSLKTSYGEIAVGNNATFGFLYKDISAQIYSRNKDALKELKESFESIEAKFPDSHFMLKKDIAYRIHLKVDSGASIQSAYKYINEIGNIFSLLIFSPVYPDSIRIIKKPDDEQRLIIQVYPSIFINKRTIELCTSDQSHFHMPIKNSNIDLASIITMWLTKAINYSTIISSIQNETGFRDEHSLHGEIVLYSTQFESISHNAGVENKQKYQYPLDSYGCEKIKNCMLKIFINAGESDVGEAIGNLRNEIAHIGKPKNLLSSLSNSEMIQISMCLQLTIIGYILVNLGVSRDIITVYQNNFIRDI